MSDFKKWLRQAYREPHTRFTEHNMEVAYLAGQASADLRVKELERERDEWKHWGSNCEAEFAEKRSAWAEQGLHLANAQKERDHYKERADILRDELERVAEPEQVKVEPYGVVYEYHDYFGKHLSFRYYQRNGNYPAKSVKVYTHPTTERPYNPLNDYAVIPMNPTEPVKAQAGEQYGQVTPTYDELVKQVSELNRLYKFDNRTMEDLVSKLDAFKVVCEKAARSIEYLLERATDSDDSAYGTLSTNFVRDCLRVNLTELNDVLGLENYVE